MSVSAFPLSARAIATDTDLGGRLVLRQLRDENLALLRQLGLLRAGPRLAAYRDPLTGLRGRGYFEARLAEELSRARARGDRLGSLLLVQVDDLEAMNRRHGRAVGGRALRWIAKVLAETLRTTDVACRTGGGRFTVILCDTDASGAAAAGDRLRSRLLRGSGLRFASGAVDIAAVSWPADGLTAPSLMEAGAARLRAEQGPRCCAPDARRLILLP
jgi:diguanylate cyclase (GGDEF)-like protein